MIDFFELNDTSLDAVARIREMTRVTSVGEKVNVHIIQPTPEPKPDFEAMRRIVASGTGNSRKVAKSDEFA